MKHTKPDELDTVAELLNALKIAPMIAWERQAAAQAVTTLARLIGRAPADVAVAEFEVALDNAHLVAQLGTEVATVRSGVARALRAFADPARRALARRLRGQLPSLAEAADAARLMLSSDEAARAARAIERLCAAEGVTPADLPASSSALEPILRRATPEIFGSRSKKALKNNVALVRRAVRLVGAPSHRTTDLRAESLPEDWRTALATVTARLAPHAQSPRAIVRRLAVAASDEGLSPATLHADFVQRFYAGELERRAGHHVEKLRCAIDAWNRDAEVEARAVLPRPGRDRIRVEALSWDALPEGIRENLDALLATTAPDPARDWAALVPDDLDDLGLGQMMPRVSGPAVLAGTVRNWRDYVKRAFQAAEALAPGAAESLDALLQPDVFVQITRMIRAKRRERLEAQGLRFDPTEKGRREHSVLEGLVSIAVRRRIDEARLVELRRLADHINPAIVGVQMRADGTQKKRYAARQIGRRHARKLVAFNEPGAMKRWFETPSVLWGQATAPLRAGKPIRQDHVALARSAVLAQLAQRVAPLRRDNLARLRCFGDDRHLILPIGDGEGRLHVPAGEVKNEVAITVSIDAETVAMLKTYIARFLLIAQRNASAAAGNPHLFPGAQRKKEDGTLYPDGFGYITEDKLNAVFRRQVQRFCALDLNLHVLRHLAGKVILDVDPSAMSLVKEILGHKRLRTTESYYAEVNAIIAQRRYWQLLDAGARRALTSLRFRIGPSDDLVHDDVFRDDFFRSGGRER